MINRSDAPIIEVNLKQQYNTNKTQKLALDIKNTKNLSKTPKIKNCSLIPILNKNTN